MALWTRQLRLCIRFVSNKGTAIVLGGGHSFGLVPFTQIMHLSLFQGGEGVNAGVGEVEWVVAKDRYKYDQTFDSLNPIDGKVTGAGTYTLQYNC